MMKQHVMLGEFYLRSEGKKCVVVA